jgi:hypothetical protein
MDSPAGGLYPQQHFILDTLCWRGQRLSIRPAQRQDIPRLVELHHALVGERPPVDRANDPAAWFALGGPWMHGYFCERHLKAYHELGFDVWIVVTSQDEFVGNVELWYDDEPEPFGRYGHIELLELLPEFFTDEVEEWLIQKAEERAAERGYRRFWCNPEGSGGSPHILRKRGYEEVWQSAQVLLKEPARLSAPAHQISKLSGDYGIEAAHLLALNHREAAGFRWRYLWRVELDPAAADWPTDAAFWAGKVEFPESRGGICLVTVWRWYAAPRLAHVDLWVEPARAEDVENTRSLLAVAAEQALRLGADELNAYLLRALACALAGGDIEMHELPLHAAWYRKLK